MSASLPFRSPRFAGLCCACGGRRPKSRRWCTGAQQRVRQRRSTAWTRSATASTLTRLPAPSTNCAWYAAVQSLPCCRAWRGRGVGVAWRRLCLWCAAATCQPGIGPERLPAVSGESAKVSDNRALPVGTRAVNRLCADCVPVPGSLAVLPGCCAALALRRYPKQRAFWLPRDTWLRSQSFSKTGVPNGFAGTSRLRGGDRKQVALCAHVGT